MDILKIFIAHIAETKSKWSRLKCKSVNKTPHSVLTLPNRAVTTKPYYYEDSISYFIRIRKDKEEKYGI